MKNINTKFENLINENDEIKKVDGRDVPNSVPITGSPVILNYLVNTMTKSRRGEWKGIILQNFLFSDIQPEMERVFGPCNNRVMRLEFMTKVWKLEYKGLHFNISSSKSKGTSIEICGYDYEDIRLGVKEKEIIEFTNKLGHTIIPY